jgi:soluble lytic murein transglycosylase-like protein
MRKLIRKKATQYNLPFELVASVIFQESGGNPWAARVEESFFVRHYEGKTARDLRGFVPKVISLRTEMWHRATSWGLMQILGETARGMGYGRDSLTKLCDPQANLEWGCRALAECFKQAPDSAGELQTREALAAYNTGRTHHEATTYDDSVLAIMASKKYEVMFE